LEQKSEVKTFSFSISETELKNQNFPHCSILLLPITHPMPIGRQKPTIDRLLAIGRRPPTTSHRTLAARC